MKAKKLTMSPELARQYVQSSDPLHKAFVLENFPELMEPAKITDIVTSFKAAFDVVKQRANLKDWIKDLVNVDHHEKVSKWLRVFVICEALKEGWEPDWDDSTTKKYYPWFKKSSSGSGFSYDYCVGEYSLSAVGSRLVYPQSDLAIFAGQTFPQEYNDYLQTL